MNQRNVILCSYNKIPPKPATEPPLPYSDVARNHGVNSYNYTNVTHETIAAIRAKALNPNKDVNLTYTQDSSTYPESFPHFVRRRGSLREYITS